MRRYLHPSGRISIELLRGWTILGGQDGGPIQITHAELGAISISLVARVTPPDGVVPGESSLRFDAGRPFTDSGTLWRGLLGDTLVMVTYFREDWVRGADLEDARRLIESIRVVTSDDVVDDPHGFVDAVAAAIEDRIGRPVDVIGDRLSLDGGELEVNIENLRAMVVAQPDTRDETIERFSEAIARAYRAREAPFDLEASRHRLYPMLRTSARAIEEALVTRPFADGLVIVYAVEVDELRLRYVTDQQRELAGVSEETLHAIALENLSKLPIEIEMHDEGCYWCVVLDSFTSSRWLLPQAWEIARQYLGDDPLIVLAARDRVWVYARSEEDAARALAREAFRDSPYPLTERVFVAGQDGLRALEDRPSGWRELAPDKQSKREIK